MTRKNRSYNVWTEKEEEALRIGVSWYGVGAWEVIRQDAHFSILKKRTGVQLKDKWRNFIKYNKLSAGELKNLPRRVSGPWSRKSSLFMKRENSSDNNPCNDTTATSLSVNIDEKENNQRNQVKKKKKKKRSSRENNQDTSLYCSDIMSTTNETNFHLPHDSFDLNKLEDRRYGIYDARRYKNRTNVNRKKEKKRMKMGNFENKEGEWNPPIRFGGTKKRRSKRVRRADVDKWCLWLRRQKHEKIAEVKAEENHGDKCHREEVDKVVEDNGLYFSNGIFEFIGNGNRGISITTAAHFLTSKLKKVFGQNSNLSFLPLEQVPLRNNYKRTKLKQESINTLTIPKNPVKSTYIPSPLNSTNKRYHHYQSQKASLPFNSQSLM